jgi:SAM-dependent methyltransferase
MIQKIKRWFQDKIGIGENRDKIYFLEKRAKLNHALIHMLLPESIQFDARNRPLDFLKKAENLQKTSFVIHKNDLMFLGILYNHNGNLNHSLNEYFQVGYATAKQLAGLVDCDNVGSFLDFGAGYGRVARFLPTFFKKAKISVSDIKEESVTFCKKELGLAGFAHAANAEHVAIEQTYDVIFAGSVFTHLPQQMAEKWLDVLVTATSNGGTLIFSIHNIATYGFAAKGDFHYHLDSEDAFFSWVEDSISDTESYGTAYISEGLATRWMNDRGFTCTIQPKAFGGTQDLVIATKNT